MSVSNKYFNLTPVAVSLFLLSIYMFIYFSFFASGTLFSYSKNLTNFVFSKNCTIFAWSGCQFIENIKMKSLLYSMFYLRMNSIFIFLLGKICENIIVDHHSSDRLFRRLRNTDTCGMCRAFGLCAELWHLQHILDDREIGIVHVRITIWLDTSLWSSQHIWQVAHHFRGELTSIRWSKRATFHIAIPDFMSSLCDLHTIAIIKTLK